MTNYEKYKEKIEEIVLSGHVSVAISAKTREITTCDRIYCKDCKFYSSNIACLELRSEWLQSEFKAPEINWQNVPVNTPVEVTNNLESWDNAVIAHLKKFNWDSEFPVTVFHDGKTSFTGPDTGCSYRRARLVRDKDVEKYMFIYDEKDLI